MGILSSIGQSLFGDPALVLFDGNCPFCRRTIRFASALDVFDQLRPINALDDQARADAGVGHLDFNALMRAMHVVTGERVSAGYEACRVVAQRLPFLWPAVPFLYLWPVPSIGRRVYRQVAESRRCTTHPSIPGSDSNALSPNSKL